MGVVDRAEWDTAFASFLENPGKWDWLVDWARAEGCLPVCCELTCVFGVNRAGEVIFYEHEPRPGCTPEQYRVTDLRLLNVTLDAGMTRYPWLSSLLPERPADAQICSMCDGTGKLPIPFACYCGGAGWVPAGDTWVNRDRFKK